MNAPTKNETMNAALTKRILVPLDIEDESRFVLKAACEMARSMEVKGEAVKLRLLHVLPERAQGELPAPNLFEPAGDSYTRMINAERILERWQDEMVPPAQQDGVMAMVARQPWSGICDVAKEYAPDVVVIGAHHYGLIARALGTTVTKVINHTKQPVYVVRPAPAARAANEEKRPVMMKKSSGEDDQHAAGVPEDPQFAIVEASALAGITGGLAVGALAGPPGMIIGGTIGAAIGLLAGSVLDVEDQRTSQHDHELDDDIGVTKGAISAREMARAHLHEENANGGQSLSREEIEASTVTINKEASKLHKQHEALEKVYTALLDSYEQGDWRDVAAQWREFEPAILAHLAFEEAHVFPIFEQINEQEAALLLGEHNELRDLMNTLAMNIELHAMLPADAEELVRRLRLHAKREEEILYPWIDLALVDKNRKRPAA